MSYTGEIRVTRPSALRDLGAAAFLVDALVVGTAVAGALAVTAAVYAAGKLVGAPAKLIGGAVRSAKAGSVKKELARAAEDAENLGARLAESMDKASADCYERYAQTASRLREIYDRGHDLTMFRTELAEAEKRLYREISEKSRALESKCIGELNGIISKSRSEMEIERREVTDSLRRLENDIEKKKKAAELAGEVLGGTVSLLNELKSAYGGSVICEKAVSECLELCAAAQAHLDSGLYEAALSDAYAAESAALTKISDIAQREIAARQRYIDVKAMLDGCRELIGSGTEVKFVFDRTADGEPLDVNVSDFGIYYRGSREKLKDELDGISERFEQSKPGDLAPEELEDMLSALSGWRGRFISETAAAYERLDNVMLRCETAELLREKYENDGYELLPPEEGDSDVQPLDCIIMRMRHSETGAELCLRLFAEARADGHIDMNIEIEDHTRYGGSSDEVELARERARESVCGVIKNSGVGKNMQIRQRCVNPGAADE